MKPTQGQIQMLICEICETAYDSIRHDEISAIVALFGLKPGWRLCRCGMAALGTVNGMRTVINDFEGDVEWPDAEPWITMCPLGAAASALLWP